MAQTEEPQKNVLRETDDAARDLARELLRASPSGALGSLDPSDGSPFTSLTTVATDLDGTPILLVSELSTHTRALMDDPRCSLLLARPGRGDPLAHPRITIIAVANFLERDSEPGNQAARRFLARHEKARLYANFGDFHFVRLAPQRASLNGGFARAYELAATDLLCDKAMLTGYDSMEPAAVAHMNDDHQPAIRHYATRLCQQADGDWRLTGIDPYGIDMAMPDAVCRYAFDPPLASANDIRPRLVELANKDRGNE